MPRRGRMNDYDAAKIIRHIVLLKQNIDAKDLLDSMIADDVFTRSDKDTISSHNPKTRQSRNEAFFDILFQRGPDAYQAFLKALRQDDRYSKYADIIDSKGQPYTPTSSVQRGSMNESDERKITKHMVAIKKDLDAQYLLPFLYQERVISENDQERILNHNRNSKENRNEAFFEIIFERGKHAYGAFIRALRTCGYSHLADLIEGIPSGNDAGASRVVVPGKRQQVYHQTQTTGTDSTDAGFNLPNPDITGRLQQLSIAEERDNTGNGENENSFTASMKLECQICLQTGKQWASLNPCNHASICLECAEKCMQRNKRCPICNQHLKGYQKIYFR